MRRSSRDNVEISCCPRARHSKGWRCSLCSWYGKNWSVLGKKKIFCVCCCKNLSENSLLSLAHQHWLPDEIDVWRLPDSMNSKIDRLKTLFLNVVHQYSVKRRIPIMYDSCVYTLVDFRFREELETGLWFVDHHPKSFGTTENAPQDISVLEDP